MRKLLESMMVLAIFVFVGECAVVGSAAAETASGQSMQQTTDAAPHKKAPKPHTTAHHSKKNKPAPAGKMSKPKHVPQAESAPPKAPVAPAAPAEKTY